MARDEAAQERPLRVLVVEGADDDSTREVRELRRAGWRPTCLRVDSGAALEAALDGGAWDIILSHHPTAGLGVEEALAIVHRRRLDLPFVLVSGTLGEESAVALLKAGIHDYVLEERLARLPGVVERELREAERRRAAAVAEAAAREQQRLLERIADTLPDLVQVFSLTDGATVYANRLAPALLGGAGDPLGVATPTAIHPDDRDATLRVRRALAAADDDAPIEFEYRVADGAGGWRWLDAHFRPFARDAGGHVVEALATALDATDRKRAEAAHALGEAKRRAVLSAIPDLILVLARDGSVRDHKPGDLDLIGHSVDAGSAVADHLPPDIARSLVDQVARALDGGGVQRVEFELTARGGLRRVESRVAAISDDEAVAIVRDLTDVRRLEAQLLAADRMVTVGTLAAGVAHEINNPLAAALGNLELADQEIARLSPGPNTPELLEMIRDAREGAERVRLIVRDLKMFSRPDEPRRHAVDVRAALESSVKMCWNEIRHRARLVRELAPVPRVAADEARLGQVFLNLIVNATQALPEREVDQNEIRLVTRERDGRVIVEVCDSGSGIAPEHIGRIFDPFFTTKPVGVGTGLGLAICDTLVRSFGGEISVESELGRGTRFIVSLPTTERPPTPMQGPPAVAVRGGRRARILVVDDEPALRRMLQRVLGAEHDVAAVASTRAALDLLRDDCQRFDVILCDLLMPDSTGMQLFDGARALLPGLEERIVFMTGGAFTPASREFLRGVGNARLDKPLDLDRVRALIAERLRARRSGTLPPG